ncbi:MAG: MFS transporter [Hyphomicrobium sp.]|nr:MFS transporter [Hyphomicrobium sp.]
MATPTTFPQATTFHGWRVVGAAFVLAVFGWGLGFYGPPVFLKILREQHGWPIAVISAAVTVHFLVGAFSGANMPALHRRYGAARITRICAVAMASGLLLWAAAREPWQMFAAALLSGAGWGGMSAAALNAIVSPWFVRKRPAALGMAYNGGSVGGILFSPLWVAAISFLGFPLAAAAIGLTAVVTVGVISATLFARTPEQIGLAPDGDAVGKAAVSVTSPHARLLPGALLWRDRTFLTLTAGMALGLFAQLGLITHLFSLLLPAFGAQRAGFAMAFVTVMAVAGRTLLGWLMPIGADRRVISCLGYGMQLAGSLAFLAAGGTNVALLLTGIALFGIGFGNATSLPPLIAQVEFVKEEVLRVVALMVAIGQATYAFAPAAFGLIRELTPPIEGANAGAAPWVFIAAAVFQGLAILAMLAGRKPR